ncbi:hypothetical protein EVAR_102544_1, partial [Eumeta japonica]
MQLLTICARFVHPASPPALRRPSRTKASFDNSGIPKNWVSSCRRVFFPISESAAGAILHLLKSRTFNWRELGHLDSHFCEVEGLDRRELRKFG